MSPRLEKAPWKQGAFSVSGGRSTRPVSAPGLCQGYEKHLDTSRSSGRFPLSDWDREPTIRERPAPAGPSSARNCSQRGSQTPPPFGGGARVATNRAKTAKSSFKRHHGIGWPHARRPLGSRQSHDPRRPGGLCAVAGRRVRRGCEPPEQPPKTVPHRAFTGYGCLLRLISHIHEAEFQTNNLSSNAAEGAANDHQETKGDQYLTHAKHKF